MAIAPESDGHLPRALAGTIPKSVTPGLFGYRLTAVKR